MTTNKKVIFIKK